MRARSWAWWTIATMGLACARSSPPSPPAPILHFADHSHIPPDELGLGTPSATPLPPSASATPHAPPTPSAIASAAVECRPAAKPPPAAVVPHRIQSGPPVTNHIPPEIIMRPVRTRAACYLAALARDPELHGRVVVHFVVEEDGWVRVAKVAKGTELPDDVASCVAAQFVGLAFPSPEGGRVQVHYPIAFEP